MNRDLQLADAKARVIGMAEAGFRPPRETRFFLPGKSGYATIDMVLYDMQLNNQISEHDRKIGRKLATVLTGGDTRAHRARHRAAPARPRARGLHEPGHRGKNQGAHDEHPADGQAAAQLRLAN